MGFPRHAALPAPPTHPLIAQAHAAPAATTGGAEIYAEVAGYALTSEAYNIMAPRPGGVGMAKTMRMALASAGVASEEVDHINAHASSTPLGDKYETMAI